ncbi:hypothetical protein QEN19_004219 [Hanseniaspora menglaensis]
MSDIFDEPVAQQESLNENKSFAVDVEDSLFISDIDNDEKEENLNIYGSKNAHLENRPNEDDYEDDDFVVNDERGNKRKQGKDFSDKYDIEMGKNSKKLKSNISISSFSQGFMEIDISCGYLTINSVGSVYYFKNGDSTTLKVEFFNNFENSNYEFEFRENSFDMCFLSNSSLLLANSSTGDVLLRNHGISVSDVTTFQIGLLDEDFITAITLNDANKHTHHKIYIASGSGSLFILDKFGNLFKKMLVPSITQMYLNGDKMFFIHNNSKYSVVLHSFKKSSDESPYIRYIQRELDLPNEILLSPIINLGISELGTPWVSTKANFYKLINSYNSNRAYWVNAMNYSNELKKINGGHLAKTSSEFSHMDETIWPIALKSSLDDLVVGMITTGKKTLTYPLQTLKNFKTTFTTVSVSNLAKLHTQQEQKILKGEEKDEDDNFVKCELNDENELVLPSYHANIDAMLEADVSKDIINSASLEAYYIADEKELLTKLSIAWDVSILRIFDVKCQCKNEDAAYSLVLSLKQNKSVQKAAEIASLYSIPSLADKILHLIDARSEL